MRAARRLTLSTPGNRPVLGKPALDAFVHDRPDVSKAGARLGIRSQGALVVQHELDAVRARARVPSPAVRARW